MLPSRSCSAKWNGCFSAAMDLSAGASRIQVLCLPPAALGVPLSSELFGLHARSRRAIWRGKGRVDGVVPLGAMPSVSCRRLRSRPVTRDFRNGTCQHGRIGKRRRPAAAVQRNVDGGAAPARLPPDGRGDVPHALPVQNRGASAVRQEGGAERAGPSGHPAASRGKHCGSAGRREGQGGTVGQEGFRKGGPIRSQHPARAPARFDRRYRSVHGRLQQPGRHRTELASQEIPRQRRQVSRVGERGGGPGIPFFALLPR